MLVNEKHERGDRRQQREQEKADQPRRDEEQPLERLAARQGCQMRSCRKPKDRDRCPAAGGKSFFGHSFQIVWISLVRSWIC